ncbi:MAG: hypothetical protein HJJLKODD_01904 [Phycisphaerae bacterium]|nr:hypothetical protein [Phycisphaerae bacterium]
MNLKKFIRHLKDHASAMALLELQDLINALRLTRKNLQPYLHFSERCYQRNRVWSSDWVEILLLCWRSGQRSPIHDHFGSACAFVVVEGQATETVFKKSPSGLIYPAYTHFLTCSEISGSEHTQIHQMGNLEADQDLITFHVYTPPLRNMQLYYLGNAVQGEDHDPARVLDTTRHLRSQSILRRKKFIPV